MSSAKEMGVVLQERVVPDQKKKEKVSGKKRSPAMRDASQSNLW